MTNDDYNNNTAFCHVMWTSFYIWPGGRVENCCASNNQIGNLAFNTIAEIISNKKQIAIKSDMQQGIRSAGCDICYPNKLTGNTEEFDYQKTQRYNFLNEFRNYDKSLYDNPESFEYRYADLRFSNTCNFACVYCTPELSSQWELELKTHKINLLTDNNIQDLTDFFHKNAHTLKTVYLAGGEPLIIKENQALLEHLYKVNPECNIKINTNLSLIKNNKIFDLLMKFKNCHWRVSVDDIFARYEYIRYPGNWNIFWGNLEYLKSKVGITNISFSVVYNALNAYTVFDLVDFLERHQYTKENIDIYMINHGQKPDHAFDPRSLPKDYLDKSLTRLKTYLNSESKRFNKNLEFIRDVLETPAPKTTNLSEDLEMLDSRRKLDSKRVFPDIYRSIATSQL